MWRNVFFRSCRVSRRKAPVWPCPRPCKANMRAIPEKKIFSFQGALVCSESCSGRQLSDFTICILAYLQKDQNNVHDVILAFAKEICRKYITIFGKRPKPPYRGNLKKSRRRSAKTKTDFCYRWLLRKPWRQPLPNIET